MSKDYLKVRWLETCFSCRKINKYGHFCRLLWTDEETRRSRNTLMLQCKDSPAAVGQTVSGAFAILQRGSSITPPPQTARIGFASTNRLIDPKWNSELINTFLMPACCSLTCHWNHSAVAASASCYTNLLCHFGEEERVIIITTPPPTAFIWPWKQPLLSLLPPPLTASCSNVFTERPWMSQMKSKWSHWLGC